MLVLTPSIGFGPASFVTREDFLVLVEDLLAYEPDESIDSPLQEIGACVVPQGSCYSCQQYRGLYNTSGGASRPFPSGQPRPLAGGDSRYDMIVQLR